MGKRNQTASSNSEKNSSSSSRSPSSGNNFSNFTTNLTQVSPVSATELTKEQRDYQRRRRNVQSAKRSRERKREEQRWIEIQVNENEDRLRHLESQVSALTAELNRPPRFKKSHPSASHNHITAPPIRPDSHSHSHHSFRNSFQPPAEERPAWFGAPFWLSGITCRFQLLMLTTYAVISFCSMCYQLTFSLFFSISPGFFVIIHVVSFHFILHNTSLILIVLTTTYACLPTLLRIWKPRHHGRTGMIASFLNLGLTDSSCYSYFLFILSHNLFKPQLNLFDSCYSCFLVPYWLYKTEKKKPSRTMQWFITHI